MRRREYEESIEQRFCTNLTKWANDQDIGLSTIKLNLKGRRGWPDRLIIWEGANILFIEFKRPGEEPRKLQLYIHEILRNMGFEVQIHDDAYIALGAVQAKVRATTSTAEKHEARSDRGRLQALLEAGEGEDGGSPEGVRHPEEKRSR